MGVRACLDLTSDLLDPINDVILAYPVIRVNTYRSCVVVRYSWLKVYSHCAVVNPVVLIPWGRDWSLVLS